MLDLCENVTVRLDQDKLILEIPFAFFPDMFSNLATFRELSSSYFKALLKIHLTAGWKLGGKTLPK